MQITEKMQKDKIFKNYFYMYRHVGITPIFTFQDDTDLIAKLRKQPSISIFTTDQCASAFFDRKSNSFQRDFQREAFRAIGEIFDKSQRLYRKHTKIMWIRDDEHPIRYFFAEKHPPFEFGCRALWDCCRKVDQRKKAMRANASTFGTYGKDSRA